MDTNQLISALAADVRRPVASLSSVWWGAAGLAIALAAAVFYATLGPRPDIAAAAETTRFVFKFVVMITLAASAFSVARPLSRPGETWRKALPLLTAAPALLAIAVISELVLLPPNTWSAKMVGTNSMTCLAYIPLIGIGPLTIFLMALRHGAPTSPAIAGAVAGLLAGGIAGTFYAAHCTDDSPLFVATWYTIAIVALASVGAVGAYRLARW
jgi:hypothetical protein